MEAESVPPVSPESDCDGVNTSLEDIAKRVKAGEAYSESVRTLLRRFGFERRARHNVRAVRQELERLHLSTLPDFTEVWIDAPVAFHMLGQAPKAGLAKLQIGARIVPSLSEDEPPTPIATESIDPTYRIKRLELARQPLVCVSPNDPLSKAITLMMTNDYSQLPVMSGERSLRGIISWKSICIKLSVAANSPSTVQDVMDKAVVVEEDESLFTVIPKVTEYDYAIVQRKDKTFSGIITSGDLNETFRALAEPFLLLGEIENHLRILLDARFKPETLQGAKDPADVDRIIKTASDLTLGEVIRFLERPQSWEQLDVNLDRGEVVKSLAQIVSIRNDVMHFDPEGIEPSDLDVLRSFVRFLRELQWVSRK